MSSINHGHRKRQKEKLLKAPDSLRDYEILELVLGLSLLRVDTKPLAKELIARFQSIRGVVDAKPAELLSVKGFGPSLLTLIVLLREFMAHYFESPLRYRDSLCSLESLARIARVRLAGQAVESVWGAFVDTKNRLLSWEKLQTGTVNQASIYPRDILERALILKAFGFFLVHNHPGGSVEPSTGDLQVTELIKKSASLVGIQFIDHIIVSDSGAFSIMTDKYINTDAPLSDL